MTAARPRFEPAGEHIRRNAYEVVTDRVLALLDRGTVPWRRTWSTAVDTPRNLQGRLYRGINTWLLGGQGYGSPHLLTWKQVHEHGGRVLKCERSTPVIFWKQLEVDEDGEKRNVPIARLYNVWNLEQCQGIAAPDQPEAHARTPVEPIVAAERIVDGMQDPPTIKVAGIRAFYRSGEDLAQVPFASRFATSARTGRWRFRASAGSGREQCRDQQRDGARDEPEHNAPDHPGSIQSAEDPADDQEDHRRGRSRRQSCLDHPAHIHQRPIPHMNPLPATAPS